MARALDPDEPDDDISDFVSPEEVRGKRKKQSFPDKRPEIEKWRHLPFDQWAPKFLKIRDENGILMPFVLRDTQLMLLKVIEEELAEQGYARIDVLKARKEGISSLIQGLGIRIVLETSGWQAGVMAHEDSACQAIFERARTMAENLPPSMKRAAQKWNRKQIAYKAPHSSAFEVGVAKGRGATWRGSDKHFVHLSEVAFWSLNRGESRAQGQLIAAANAVPRVKGTIVVIESTANGAGNEFHRLWNEAEPLPGQKQGKNGFRRVFFGWQDFTAYRLPGKAPADLPALPEWVEDEPRLRSLGIDEEQLAWRRWKIATDCGGDLDAFKQEYPAYPEEAFLATGTSVFPPSMIQTRLAEIEAAEKADLKAGFKAPRWRFSTKGVAEEDPHGELRFFRTERGSASLDLKDRDRFALTADPTGSSASGPDQQKGDPAVAYVWDRKNNEQIAEWRGWCEPDEFAQVLVWLGALYGNPVAIVEAGPWGGHVISSLQRLGYERIYFRERLGEQLQYAPTNFGQYGWLTSGKSKQEMIDALKQMWRTGSIRINSAICCQGHLTFVKKGPIKREAQDGCHDDTVMACAIYALWALQHPYEPPPERTMKRGETYGDVIKEMLDAEDRKVRSGGWALY